ncbi:MAG: tRNA pseudouridine(55) synthase TruB [Clostridia bacterium]|nr:tRNA pseudouridine(55) synthase TruB [Clostridia bacterium]
MEKNGLLVVNKPVGITSHTAVAKIRRLFGVEKAGHTGTLDPMAAGVLPVLVGRAVKAAEFLTESDKRYRAVLTLGVTTDTEDATGTVLSRSDAIPDEAAVLSAIAGFIGEIEQTPPMYSAIKVGGRKLLDLARRGETVERESRTVTVYRLDAERIDERNYALDAVVSKGTYIRTLCADVGRALGCGGIMSALTRTSACGFSLSDAAAPDELEQMTEEERAARIIPTENLFPDAEKLSPDPFFVRLLRNGLRVETRKLGIADAPLGTRFRLYDGDVFFALAEVREPNGEDGETRAALAPLRQFDV